MFYLNREFGELNLIAFNSIIGFPPNLDLDRHDVPGAFNPNAFWYIIAENYYHYASHTKGTIIQNPCIRVAQRVFPCGLFAREDSLNVPCLSEPYFLHSLLEVTSIEPGSFFANQLLSEFYQEDSDWGS